MVKLYGPVGRLALFGAAVVTVLGVSAAPASARVEVRADDPRPGASDVTVTFVAEAQSRVAGIAFLRVTLPAGIAPSDVSLLTAPDGWRLSQTSNGYNVGGPPLEVGQNAGYRVNVERLPANARQLTFETLQTYSDGRIESDNPTPVLTLATPPPPPPARPPVQEPPAPRPPAQQPVPPAPPRETIEVPPPPTSIPPTFSVPTESPAAEVPATIEPDPNPTAAALAEGADAPAWQWLSAAAVITLLLVGGLLTWWRRRSTKASA